MCSPELMPIVLIKTQITILMTLKDANDKKHFQKLPELLFNLSMRVLSTSLFGSRMRTLWCAMKYI